MRHARVGDDDRHQRGQPRRDGRRRHQRLAQGRRDAHARATRRPDYVHDRRHAHHPAGQLRLVRERTGRVMERGPEVAYFLAELYLPSTGAGGTAEAVARARGAAEEVAREGVVLRFLRIIFVPGDETCFVAYEAATSEAVAEAGRRAGLDFERIVAAVEAK